MELPGRDRMSSEYTSPNCVTQDLPPAIIHPQLLDLRKNLKLELLNVIGLIEGRDRMSSEYTSGAGAIIVYQIDMSRS